MNDRDEFRAQVAAALFYPGSSVDQAVERAISVVAEEIAQAMEYERDQLGDGGLAGAYEHAAAIARRFKLQPNLLDEAVTDDD
jgi:hypothetical protein